MKRLSIVLAMFFASCFWDESAKAFDIQGRGIATWTESSVSTDPSTGEALCACTRTYSAVVLCNGSLGIPYWSAPAARSVLKPPLGCLTTCLDGASTVSPQITPCPGSTSSAESSDGVDNNLDGQVDTGGSGTGGLCLNYRTDPVQVGSGAFVTEPTTDVLFAGSSVPIRFTRQYSSRDGWPYGATQVDALTRLGSGWTHTFDERLFSATRGVVATPTATGVSIIHRGPDATGRVFTNCSSSGSCSTNDGSLDRLSWDGTKWKLAGADGVTTSFYVGGGLDSKSNALGERWEVVYATPGDPTTRIAYVKDHFDRQLKFVWSSVPNRAVVLNRLLDFNDNVLATFVHDDAEPVGGGIITGGLWLRGATSSIGSEQYEYLSAAGSVNVGAGPSTRPIIVNLPYLTGIKRGGLTVTSISYEPVTIGNLSVGPPDLGTGRVTSIVARDGSFSFRYANAANNSCTDSSRTTMVIDRSTQLGSSSCTADSDCTGVGGKCELGYCRAFTCQSFAAPTTGGVNYEKASAIIGNYTESPTSNITWVDAGVSAPNRISEATTRDGRRTSYQYDANGRIIARCIKDTNAVVTRSNDPAATDCPADGEYTGWEYTDESVSGYPFAQHVRYEKSPSRLSPTAMRVIETVRDTITGQVTSTVRSGYSRDLAGAITSLQPQTTIFTYTTFGRVESITGPAGEYVWFTYHPIVAGDAKSGMLKDTKTFWGPNPSDFLVSTNTFYNSIGRVTARTEVNGSPSAVGFQVGNESKPTLVIQGGLVTNIAYDSAGRVDYIAEPSGKFTKFIYDAQSRVVELRNSNIASPSVWEGVRYTYDAAGRVTLVQEGAGTGVGAGSMTVIRDRSMTYNEYNFLASFKLGTEGTRNFTYDTNRIGNLTGAINGGGDQTGSDYDVFGRSTLLRRKFTSGGSWVDHALSYLTTSGFESGEDLPTSVTPPGGTARTYVYDDFGQIVRSNSPEFGTHRWLYTNGRLVTYRNAANVDTTFSYDRMGRVTVIDQDSTNATVGLEQDYQFDYDNGGYACPETSCSSRVGKLAQVRIEYAAGLFWTMNYNYNAFGAVTYESQVDGRIARYTYDVQGRLYETINPAAGQKIRYDYVANRPWRLSAQREVDAAGTTTLVNWAKDYEYNGAQGLYRYKTHDLNLIGSYWNAFSYLPGGHLIGQAQFRATSASTVSTSLDRAYSYAADGALYGHYSYSTGLDPHRTYLMDRANRVTCALEGTASGTDCTTKTGQTRIDSFVMDNRDARTQRLAETYTLDASTNALTSVNSGGNIRDYAPGPGMRRSSDSYNSANKRFYSYDAFGKLRTITGAVSLNVLYDHVGRPIQVTDTTGAAKTTTYYYNQAGELWGSTLNDPAYGSAVHRQYVRTSPTQIGERVVWVGFGSYYYYHQTELNGLPTTGYQFSTTIAGSTSETYRNSWSPYGQLLSPVDADTPPFRALGQIELAGSNVGTTRGPLYLNSWRTYDPQVGSYLQPEPLLIDGSLVMPNAWGYAGADPVNNVDLDGRDFSRGAAAAVGLAPAATTAARPALRLLPGGTGSLYGAGLGRIIPAVPWARVAAYSAMLGGIAYDVGKGMLDAYLASQVTQGRSAFGPMCMAAEALEPMSASSNNNDDTFSSRRVLLGLRNHGTRELASRIMAQHFLDAEDWRIDVLASIADPTVHLHVNVSGFQGEGTYSQIMSAVQRGLTPNARATEWEMAMIYQMNRMGSVSFLDRDGTPIANPF